MDSKRDKIVIIDEAGFSQICSSILRKEGFKAERFKEEILNAGGCGIPDAALFVTSYPYAEAIIDTLKELATPVIVLSDHVGRELIETLEGLENSFCMVKPIDYSQFTSLVKSIMSDNMLRFGGYSIV